MFWFFWCLICWPLVFFPLIVFGFCVDFSNNFLLSRALTLKKKKEKKRMCKGIHVAWRILKTKSLRIWSYCWINVWFSFNLAFHWVKSFTCCTLHSEFDYCQCALNYAYYICWMKPDLLVLWFFRTSWSKQKCYMSIWKDVTDIRE
jgi:hypothetical protein